MTRVFDPLVREFLVIAISDKSIEDTRRNRTKQSKTADKGFPFDAECEYKQNPTEQLKTSVKYL
ncbi:MAG: hypothetical protein FWC11_00560 [Firmicutes bacterium]|nr:hypothetical protein [Bacillota bacterium]